MTPTPAATGFRITGWHVAIAVTTFFGVIIAVDAAFLITAYRTFPGQVSATPYEDGLTYNREVARRRQQTALGWQATAAGSGDSVVLEIQSASGEPISGLSLSGDLSRPATEAGRIALEFSETTPGRYVARATPGSGVWDLRFLATQNPQTTFEGERRLTWP